jgi:hypothetical protein
MDQPEVVQCPDHSYQHGIWGFGSYIGDYLEQTLLACIVQNWCARYEILWATCLSLNKFYSCPAPPKNLDDPIASQQRRTKARTEVLVMTQDVPTLWTEHGIISDVIVRL